MLAVVVVGSKLLIVSSSGKFGSVELCKKCSLVVLSRVVELGVLLAATNFFLAIAWCSFLMSEGPPIVVGVCVWSDPLYAWYLVA